MGYVKKLQNELRVFEDEVDRLTTENAKVRAERHELQIALDCARTRVAIAVRDYHYLHRQWLAAKDEIWGLKVYEPSDNPPLYTMAPKHPWGDNGAGPFDEG